MIQIGHIIGGSLVCARYLSRSNKYVYVLMCKCSSVFERNESYFNRNQNNFTCGNSNCRKTDSDLDYVVKSSLHHMRKNWPTSLTFNQVEKLILSDCSYCGRKPRIMSGLSSGDRKVKIATMGIDRKNSKVGYTSSNSISCCQWCNRMKLNLSEREFYKHIFQVHKYQNGRNSKYGRINVKREPNYFGQINSKK